MYGYILWQKCWKKSYTYNILENSQTKLLARTEQIKDLGILLDERLSFRDHINDKINKAFSMLGIVNVILNTLQFNHLLCYIKRSHLYYCSFVWSPYMKKDIEALEKVQKSYQDSATTKTHELFW